MASARIECFIWNSIILVMSSFMSTTRYCLSVEASMVRAR